MCHVDSGTSGGNGTYQRNGFIYSSLAGYLKTDKNENGQVKLHFC